MRIRNLLLLCIGLLGLLAGVSASFHAVQATVDRHRLQISMRAAAGLRQAMSLSELISAERRKVGTLFSKPPPEGAGDLDAVKNARVAVEAGLAATLPFADGITDTLIASNGRLRQFYDVALETAKADSSVAAVDADRAFVLAAADTQKVITRIIDEQETTVSRLSPEYGQLVALARLSQQLRDTAGLRSALLSAALASQNLTHAELRQMDELNGQISALWERIQLTVAEVGPASPALRDACKLIADTIMGEGDRRYRSLITNLGQGEPPEMSVGDYRKWTSPMLTHALALRNAVFSDLEAKFAANMRQKTALMLLGALSALVSLAATGGAVWQVMRRVAIPLSHLTGVVTRMAEGELDVEITGGKNRDELGALASAIVVLRDSAKESRHLREVIEAEERAKLSTADVLTAAAVAFEQASISKLLQVREGETMLKSTVQSIDLASRRTAEQTLEAARGVAATALQVETLVAAVNQVELTVVDVASRMSGAASAVAGAESEARGALAHIGELTRVAGRISAVLDVITTIAGKARLLALNATIEAARAGHAGKSFAVVAEEVKSLAAQTARATEEVAGHVKAIHFAIRQTGGGIATLSAQVGAVTKAASSVVVAVQQQRTATDEIALAARTASTGAAQAAVQVAEAAERTQAAQELALTLPGLAAQVAGATGSLRLEIDRFISVVSETGLTSRLTHAQHGSTTGVERPVPSNPQMAKRPMLLAQQGA